MIAGLATSDNLPLLALCAGLGVFAVVIGLHHLLVPLPVEQRLSHFVGGYQATSPAARDELRANSSFLETLDRRMARRGQSATSRILLQRANLRMTVAELLALRIGGMLLCGGVAALWLFPRLGIFGALLAAAIAFVGNQLPLLFVRLAASRRVAALEAQLPDALDMTAAALQAGAGVAQAFGVIAREMPPPISEEFRRVLREVEIGLSLNEALNNLVERIGSEDLDLVVTTINVQTRVGGNLVNILRTITTTIRERIRIRGEVKVLTAMQRMSAMVISGVPPVLGFLIWLLNPGYVGRLFQPGIGEVLLITSAIMEVAGFLVLRRITDIEV